MAPMKPIRPQNSKHPSEDSHSLTHLAHRWGVSRKVIRNLLSKGDLPFIQIDGQIRVPDEAVRQVEGIQDHSISKTNPD